MCLFVTSSLMNSFSYRKTYYTIKYATEKKNSLNKTLPNTFTKSIDNHVNYVNLVINDTEFRQICKFACQLLYPVDDSLINITNVFHI